MIPGDFDGDQSPTRTRIFCPRIGCTGSLMETSGYIVKRSDLVSAETLYKPFITHVLTCEICGVIYPDIIPRRDRDG